MMTMTMLTMFLLPLHPLLLLHPLPLVAVAVADGTIALKDRTVAIIVTIERTTIKVIIVTTIAIIVTAVGADLVSQLAALGDGTKVEVVAWDQR